MSKQSGRKDEGEEIAAALASDPRALEAYNSASPAHLLDLLARACAAGRADVSVFASSALLAAARRGALPHEHWETALSVCAAPNCAEAARSQCARALAAAAARSPTALDDALAEGVGEHALEGAAREGDAVGPPRAQLRVGRDEPRHAGGAAAVPSPRAAGRAVHLVCSPRRWPGLSALSTASRRRAPGDRCLARSRGPPLRRVGLLVLRSTSWDSARDRSRRTAAARLGAAAPHVLTFCDDDALLEQWVKSNAELERVQKNLADYLETKRAAFARFYFLSNDELISILSPEHPWHRIRLNSSFAVYEKPVPLLVLEFPPFQGRKTE